MKEVKTFQQMHRDGLINRREFLTAMGALGLSATTAAVYWCLLARWQQRLSGAVPSSLRRTCMAQMTP